MNGNSFLFIISIFSNIWMNAAPAFGTQYRRALRRTRKNPVFVNRSQLALHMWSIFLTTNHNKCQVSYNFIIWCALATVSEISIKVIIHKY